jgi:hypothetical protein
LTTIKQSIVKSKFGKEYQSKDNMSMKNSKRLLTRRKKYCDDAFYESNFQRKYNGMTLDLFLGQILRPVY